MVGGVIEERRDRVVIGVLNRPEKLNAFDVAQYDAMSDLLDRALGRVDREGRHPEQPLRGVGTVVRQPAVVSVEAGFLVIEVRVVAEHHAHARIDDLTVYAVTRLVLEPGIGIPTAAV